MSKPSEADGKPTPDTPDKLPSTPVPRKRPRRGSSTSRTKTASKTKRKKPQIKTYSITQSEVDLAPVAAVDTSYEGGSPVVEDERIVFKPNKGPQTDFLAADEREVLFGGAAGGGKSYALLGDAARFVENKNYRALILRKTTDELRELISTSKDIYPLMFPGAKWSNQKSTWTFPSGATIWMTYCDRDDDVKRFQGQAFSYIAFDELTHWHTPYAWKYLSSRLRSADPTLPLYMRATTNPGGPGHGWVKKLFIDPAPHGYAFWATDVDTGEVMRYPTPYLRDPSLSGKPLYQRRFIPAKLSDNPYLYSDGQYEQNLLALPEAERKRLLDGNWDVAEGAAFTEWDRSVHVIKNFDIPREWPKFRSCDYGYSSFTSVLWFTIAPNGQMICYRDLYVSKVRAADLAYQIKNLERNDGNVLYGVLDSSCWHERGDYGPSIAEQMIMRGCRWRPADRSKGSRVAGKNMVHHMLSHDDFIDAPNLVFFETCLNVTAHLPVLPLSKLNVEDVDTKANIDHTYDALRYAVMTRPQAHHAFEEQDYGNDHYAPADTTFGY